MTATDPASLTAAANLLHSLTSATTDPEPTNRHAWLGLAFDQLQHWLHTSWPTPDQVLPETDRALIEALTETIAAHETTQLLLLNTASMVLRSLHEPAGSAAALVHAYCAGVRIVIAITRCRPDEAAA